jgi:hypothetical protein
VSQVYILIGAGTASRDLPLNKTNPAPIFTSSKMTIVDIKIPSTPA